MTFLNYTRPYFTIFQVRAYAVSVLERADDEELQCYLLQLVQALRFERSDKSRLSHFLVQRGMCNRALEQVQVFILFYSSFLKGTYFNLNSIMQY